jgi:hypothetical protein
MRILLASVALVLIPFPANAKSDCISRAEIKQIVQTGPKRPTTEKILGWEGRYESRRFSAYRKCGYSWDEKYVVLGYVNDRVWFVTTISLEET